MSIEAERLEQIRANAAFVVEKLGEISGMDFGLDEASVGWVEGFIERQRASLQGADADGLVNVLGCYLGEAVIAAVPDARWEEDAIGGLGVAFANGDMAYPVAKVAKQFANGLAQGDSIRGFYDVTVNFVATGKLRSSAGEKAP
jgi:hypothetical protein